MNQYKIYQSKEGVLEVVKQSWSWPAFLFTWIWALIKGLWGLAVPLIVLWILLQVISTGIERGTPVASLMLIIVVCTHVFCGVKGNEFREKKLINTGYTFIQTVKAANVKEALSIAHASPKNEKEEKMHLLEFNPNNIDQFDFYDFSQSHPMIHVTIDKIALDDYVATFGLDPVIALAANKIIPMIPNHLAYQFVLEELQFASLVENENQIAADFVQNSQIPRSEYQGKALPSFFEIDGPGGPQQTLHVICLAISDKQVSSELRTEVAKRVMQHFGIGNFKV